MKIAKQASWVADEVLSSAMRDEIFGVLGQCFELLRPLNQKLEAQLEWAQENVEGGEAVSHRALLLALVHCMTKSDMRSCDDRITHVMAEALATGEGLY